MDRVKMLGLIISMGILLIMSGCAEKASKIKATYVSPLKYEKHSCNRLRDEVIRINEELLVISGQQDEKSESDAVAMGVGLVLFWPALFFLASGEDQKVEIGRLKGEYNAIKDAAYRKKCKFASQMK